MRQRDSRHIISEQRGMTLVELLIVISIITLLLQIALPAVESSREAARQAQCQNNLRQITLAFQIHCVTHGHYPSSGWGWQWVGHPDRGYDTDPLNQYVWHPYYIDALAVRFWDSNVDGDYLDTNEGDHYYAQDANFNVTAVVNTSGTVLERYSYSPYGEVTFLNDDFSVKATQATAIGNTHLYTGRERDSETGLQLNRHRYYASHLGSWTSRDPIVYEGSEWNLYEYARNRPINGNDPFGLVFVIEACTCPRGATISGFVWCKSGGRCKSTCIKNYHNVGCARCCNSATTGWGTSSILMCACMNQWMYGKGGLRNVCGCKGCW